jgi:hypothetical protein
MSIGNWLRSMPRVRQAIRAARMAPVRWRLGLRHVHLSPAPNSRLIPAAIP